MTAHEEKRFAPSASFARGFRSAEAFSAAIPGGRFEAIAGTERAFSGVIRLVNLAEGVSLRSFSLSAPVTLRSEMVGGDTPTITFLLPLTAAPKVMVDGVDLGPAALLSRQAGDRPAFRTGGPLELAALCLLNDRLREAAEALTGRAQARLLLAPATLRQADPARLRALQAVALRIGALVAAPAWAETARRAPLLRLLRGRLEAALVQVLEGDDWRPDHLAHQRQSAAMRRIDRLIEDQGDTPLDLRDLCETSGLALRTVESIIRRRMGMTAHAYLQRRQLTAVRRALLSPAPQATVTTVALDHGFTHFGRFAALYRRSYGELPSQTLRNVRGPVPQAESVFL